MPAMQKHLLDNIAWHCLSQAQSRFAVGAGGARRYAPGHRRSATSAVITANAAVSGAPTRKKSPKR